MFKTVGETSELEYDENGEFMNHGYDPSGMDDNSASNGNHHDYASASSESSDSPKTMKKMFWHASRIDKVQELVPEQIRYVRQVCYRIGYIGSNISAMG